jgi:hypothetical protein
MRINLAKVIKDANFTKCDQVALVAVDGTDFFVYINGQNLTLAASLAQCAEEDNSVAEFMKCVNSFKIPTKK